MAKKDELIGGKFRSAWIDFTRKEEFPPGGGPGDSLTKQAPASETDINQLLDRFSRTGVLPTGAPGAGMYGDFSQVTDYRQALQIVLEADAKFMELPAKLRSRFDNDPAKFLEFVENPANLKEMIKLGLAKERPPEAAEAPAVAPSSSGASAAAPKEPAAT